MYGVALMHLAHLVGLRQVDIARISGSPSVQANHWAKGIRPIPEATVPTLVKRIAEAVERSLHTGETDRPTRADLTDRTPRRLCRKLPPRRACPGAKSGDFTGRRCDDYAALTRPQQLEGQSWHTSRGIRATHAVAGSAC